ncbi:LacI family transcriptional regulator [Massilia arenosa]|uniref:LacI family transcriptional regulator n=1 Tax=Zemynaea arenosa TaxID=2561931 RepID=A0A4Y9SBL6_9BURK|nr:LacI family DNA-binding transcriptional regulator [Massilia arenosa]TFW19329.1 LacI family transcriptional regulator [Massilia arenosa]
MAVTIRDIAQACEVSTGTVSRALKDQPGLTESTRLRIRAAAEAMGYDTRQLKPRRIRRVLFVLHSQHNNLSATPFYSPVLHGAEQACREHGIALSFAALAPGEGAIARIRLHLPDAILCAGFFEPEVLSAMRGLGLPMALVDLSQPQFACANPDHRLGGYIATRHLLQLGRKRIALLCGSLAHFSIRERAHGFRQALFDAHVLADPSYEAVLPDGEPHEVAVQQAMEQLLALNPRPDGLFCFNDSTAIAAMRHCLGAGLRIPEDIAVVGFDDIEPAARANPPLTSVHIDKEELGAAGIALLLNQPAMQEHEHEHQVLPVRLVLRASSIGQ